MKKVGIITWYKNGNYGGTLQAYALAHTIQEFGYQPEFIDYYEQGIYRKARHCFFNLLYPRSGQSRQAIWDFVRSEFQESPIFKTETELCSYVKKQYDAVICGSDQIWSSINGVNPIYFLQFVEPQKRISYAPSIGINKIKDEYLYTFKKYVQSIPYLSVRELQGSEYIKNVTGKTAKVVLDPTLLLEKEKWLELTEKINLKKSHRIPQNYILCYFLGNDALYQNYVASLIERTKLQVMHISTSRKRYGESHVICNPFEFVNLISHATYVLTDSYHGTIFSINLGTKVGVLKRFSESDPKNQNSRIYSILSLLEMQSLLVKNNDSTDSLINMGPYPIESVHKLRALRADSLAFLQNSLRDVFTNR